MSDCQHEMGRTNRKQFFLVRELGLNQERAESRFMTATVDQH